MKISIFNHNALSYERNKSMKKLLDIMTDEFAKAFKEAGYDEKYARVSVSNRPDLCEYQCNGAMAAAKEYKKAPFVIAEDIAEKIKGNSMFKSVEAVKPGFINIIISEDMIAGYIEKMADDEKLGYECDNQKTVIIDYGGPNVAKPLHVGHLRSAIIGESLKRMFRFAGNKVIGDAHLGDWGLQMGLIIEQLHDNKPELPYFDEAYAGEYPKEPPFTLSELEQIYPEASARSKTDEEFKERAQSATFKLQKGYKPYRALWQHIINISVEDLKKNYRNLNVEFDLWNGESDVEEYIDDMVADFEKKGLAHESQGALVVDVKEETDTKEIPPCIIKKSDGAALYATTDLATILMRVKDYNPDQIIYVVDKRQEMHFVQVFRAAKKAGISGNAQFTFQGFGTMNGKDGKPFKTREGGVMRLETLISEINGAVYNKIMDNRQASEEEAEKIAKIVGLAAIKYGDLSNQASKDYVFDIDRFTSFEGNTGPYILYTIVRIKSIMEKYKEMGKDSGKFGGRLNHSQGESEKQLMIELSRFNDMMEGAYEEMAPHRICAYIYDLSNAFNKFYHENKIIAEENEEKQAGYIRLLEVTRKTLETSIDILGFSAPDRM